MDEHLNAVQTLANELTEHLNAMYREMYQRVERKMSEAIKAHPALAWAEKYKYPVPDDATIPDGMEVASFNPTLLSMTSHFEMYRTPSSRAGRLKNGCIFYTAEPVKSPKPEPQPDEIRFAPKGSRHHFALRDELQNGKYPWFVPQRGNGGWDRLSDDDVADWPLARLVPNGRGVMDEENKCDRVTAGEERVEWDGRCKLWRVYTKLGIAYYGTLAALAATGRGVTLAFADGAES